MLALLFEKKSIQQTDVVDITCMMQGSAKQLQTDNSVNDDDKQDK